MVSAKKSEVAAELETTELKIPVATVNSDVTEKLKAKNSKTKKSSDTKNSATTEDPDADLLETAAGHRSNANKPHVLHNIKAIVQSNKFIALAALLGLSTVGITKKLLTTDTTPNQTIDNDMYDAKDTPNYIGYSTVYILVTILIACLLITIGLTFYIAKIAYPYNTHYTIL